MNHKTSLIDREEEEAEDTGEKMCEETRRTEKLRHHFPNSIRYDSFPIDIQPF